MNTPISAFLDRRREKKYQHALEREEAFEKAQARAREIEEQKAKLKDEKRRMPTAEKNSQSVSSGGSIPGGDFR